MAADTECALSVTKAATGSGYDGSQPGSQRIGSCVGKTGKASTWSQDQRTNMRKFWEVQATTYEQSASGWLYWNWKTEAADEWSYYALVNAGVIPMNPSERKYPHPC